MDCMDRNGVSMAVETQEGEVRTPGHLVSDDSITAAEATIPGYHKSH